MHQIELNPMPRLLVFITVVLLTSCNQNNDHLPPSAPAQQGDKFAEKTYLYYDLELEKEFPNTELSIKGYLRGKKQVQKDIRAELNKSGFDEPWTIQGPGNLGARINTVAVNPDNEDIIFVGYSGGGLWRTLNGGQTWESIFDTEIFNAISDITIDPNDTNTIYIGTGDPNIPGLAYIGEGIFKSTDNGDTWAHAGLTEQRVISKVRIHPEDSDILYVGSMGLPFTRNDSRGLYRSMNAGADWKKIFYVSDSTGVSDVLINPEKPEIINVATWDRVRNNSESLVVGEGSGIFVSQDSGDTWNRAAGIPDTILCRTGLAYCKNFPENVYAITMDTAFYISAIYRSRDYGVNFTEINTSMLQEYEIGAGFGWYFGKLEVDPNDPDHIYVLEVDLWETYNNGEDWLPSTPPWSTYEVHADKHDLQIMENGNLYLATDGGLYKGRNGDPENWEDIENIPTTQIYRVGYNPHKPDDYYGGAQDNGTTAGNANNINEWPRIYGGDGFQTAFSPFDPDHWFAEYQSGEIVITLDDGEFFFPATDGLFGERNWDMQYLISPHNSSVMYTGTDHVFRAIDSYYPVWSPISDNMTQGGFATSLDVSITSIDESPITEGILYIGTSNGLVHMSLDAGENWNLISEDLPSRYITSVKASPSNAETAYVTLSGYKDNDSSPRVFRTDDFGSTWTNISTNLPDIALNDIFIIPEMDDRILFVATDGGIYASINRGQEWTRLGVGMPNIVCYDMDYNVVNKELIVATFGRAIMTYPLSMLFDEDTATDDLAEMEIEIYPNPTTDYLFLDITNKTLLSEESNFSVISADGGQVMNGSLNGTEEPRIDVSRLETGNYYFIVTNGKKRFSQSFVKQ